MISFLLAALIVFLISVIIFSSVFIVAIRLRLLPVQPEIEQFVDLWLSILFNGHGNVQTSQPTISLPTNIFKYEGPQFGAVAKVVVVATLVVLLQPNEQRFTTRVQNGRQNLDETISNCEPIVAKTIILNIQENV